MPQTILVVDDDREIARLVRAYLEQAGFRASCANDGASAMRALRSEHPDLLILDLMLPDRNGLDIARSLRADPATAAIPIIMLTARVDDTDRIVGLELGADDYITKPFSDVELNARVQAAMRRSEREGGANPSTRLPGNIAIERAISQRIAQNDSKFVVCYCDIDNFKAYNDTYGFLKGDAVIQRTAQILLDTVREYGNPDDFVGHIGGDDFVVITSLSRLAVVCNTIISQFDATAPLLYDRAARTRGFIDGEDRQGRPTVFPLVSISIIAVSPRLRPLSHPGEVAQRSVEPKKRAKLIPGSVLIVTE